MYIANTQDEAPESCNLVSVDEPSTSSIPEPSSSRDAISSSTSSPNPSRCTNSNDVSPNILGQFTHLSLNPSKQKKCSSVIPERTRRLKALPTCQVIKEFGRKAMGQLNKSFELTEQQPLFEDLGPVENLKNKANNDLIQHKFKALVEYSACVKSCYKGFQAIRQSIDELASAEHTPIHIQVEAVLKLGDELRKNKAALGESVNILLNTRSHTWEFQKTVVNEAQGIIESALYTQHGDIQLALDMLKQEDRPLSKVKGPSGFATAALEAAGKYRFWKVGNRSRNGLQDNRMLEATYQEEKAKTDSLNQNLTESADSIRDATYTLYNLEYEIYTQVFIVIDEVKEENTPVTYLAMANKLDETEGMLLTFIELLDEFLAQTGREYGVKCGTGQAKRLCSRIPNIFTALELLLSAKEVIVDEHQFSYEEHIYELCKAISEHFDVMEGIHWECRDDVNTERQTAFLRGDVPRFQRRVASHLQAIKDIAGTHISKAKSKQAYEKRAKQDRFHGNSSLTRPRRPLVTGEEILWALHKVIEALLLIGVVSGGSTTSDPAASEKFKCTGEKTTVNGSLPWLKMDRHMVNELRSVLYHENGKLKMLEDHRQANSRSSSDEHQGRFFRLLGLMSRKSR